MQTKTTHAPIANPNALPLDDPRSTAARSPEARALTTAKRAAYAAFRDGGSDALIAFLSGVASAAADAGNFDLRDDLDAIIQDHS